MADQIDTGDHEAIRALRGGAAGRDAAAARMSGWCCLGCARPRALAGDHVVVDERGKRWNFEMHPYCGPIVLRRDGQPAARQPGSRSPFWKPFEQWQKARKLPT